MRPVETNGTPRHAVECSAANSPYLKELIMKQLRYIPVMLIATSLFAGCSSMPNTNARLEEARSDFQVAQSNITVATLAPLELKQASDALDSANVAWEHRDSDEKVNQLAYVAKQKIATSQEVAKQKASEMAVANAAKERDQIRLEQRTREADKAKLNAAIAQDQTRTAQMDTADAQRKQMEAEAHARQLEAQLSDLAAQKTARGIVVTFGDVLFSTDKAELKTEGMSNVQKLSEILKQNPQRVVLIEGFTDSTGSAAHNQELSERRAMSVSTALIEMGISRDRISTRGYGEAYPVANNDNASGRQINRRVEIVLSDDSGKIPPR
jgi:outer membrane protein OmpA-like peptidoglycan-associated protein